MLRARVSVYDVLNCSVVVGQLRKAGLGKHHRWLRCDMHTCHSQKRIKQFTLESPTLFCV